jgi:hypothetical protein
VAKKWVGRQRLKGGGYRVKRASHLHCFALLCAVMGRGERLLDRSGAEDWARRTVSNREMSPNRVEGPAGRDSSSAWKNNHHCLHRLVGLRSTLENSEMKGVSGGEKWQIGCE